MMKLTHKEKQYIDDLNIRINRNGSPIYWDEVRRELNTLGMDMLEALKEHLDKPFWLSGYNGGGHVSYVLVFEFNLVAKVNYTACEIETFMPVPYKKYDFVSTDITSMHSALDKYLSTKQVTKKRLPWYKKILK